MKKSNNKTMKSLIALLLIITFAVSFIAILPITNAQLALTQYKSYMYVGVSPLIVGVGQEVIIVTWTADIPPDVGETNFLIPSPNGRAAWNSPQTVTVTRPDGTNETLILPRTDPVGATWILYTPQQVGTYSLQAYFPGEYKNSTSMNRYYTPDYSPATNFTVQQDPVENSWPETPLPTDYWNRPLNSANHEWYALAGSWLSGAAQNYPQGTAGITSNHVNGKGTETPHILWTKQYYPGGLMDEAYNNIGYQTQHYQGMSLSGIVLNGKFHYTPRTTAQGNQGWKSLDLYTGQELFSDVNATRPSMGQILDYASPNQHGGFAYLWRTSNVVLPPTVQVPNVKQFPNGSVVRITAVQTFNSSQITPGTLWEMLDGFTGQTITYIANVSSGGTAVYGKDGSILRYAMTNTGNITNPAYRLTVWNSSYGTMPSSQLGTGYWQWRPAGGTFGGSNAYLGGLAYNYVHDGRVFFSVNVSMPSVIGALNGVSNQTASISMIKQDQYLIATAAGFNNGTHNSPGFVMKISLVPGQEGTLISKKEFIPPSSEGGTEAVALDGVYPDDGIILYSKAKTVERFGYSIETGQQVWKSEPEVQFQYYGMSESYYNGTLFSYGYGGVLTAYEVKTGKVLWQYYPYSIGTESAYGGVYPLGVTVIADGKLYTITGEHSPTQPLYRGPNLRCLDAATGKEIWKILGFFGGMSPTSSNILMADGILLGLNHFDNQIYAFGKGPSGTTVTVESDVSVYGTKVMVKGTVTDQSPVGRRNINDVLEIPLKGTPAISDADQQAWMEYLFMQQAKPTNAKGVPVSLDTIDPNGNYVHIGDVTSDMNGNFALPYTPEVTGNYQIIATFAGSKAYGPSSATTYITVEDAPAATATPSPLPVSIADQYFVPAIAGIIVAIAIVGVILALLLLKKRP